VADSQNSTENGTLLTDDIVTTNDNISQMSSNADDIVTRLRIIHCAADDLTPCGTCLTCQAADEIERLRKELEQSRQDHLATFLELMEERRG
jgi:hypothetical protein